MKLRRSILTATFLASAMAFSVPTGAHAANINVEKEAVYYSRTVSLIQSDQNTEGLDHGDLFLREQAVSKTLNGPTIGVAYSQAEVVAHHVADDVDVRRIMIQSYLPKGEIFTLGTSQSPRGATPRPGWTTTYAIIGGTGKYKGARGVEKITLLDDGVTFKIEYTYTTS